MAPLDGGVDDQDAAEAFSCETAEVLLDVAIQQQDLASRRQQLERGSQARNPATDDDDGR
jgi:hypothetical protein